MDERHAARMARWRVPLGLGLGVLYLVFAQPSAACLEAGSAIALLGLGLRAVAAGYLEKNERLATEGPYAYTRNPLYLGSLLIGIGVTVAGRTWFLGAVFLLFFIFVYFPVIQREAEELRRRFGRAYEQYAEQVPLFFPTARHKKPAEQRFRWSRYVRNREYEAALGYVAAVLFLAIKIKLR
jgi:protein-S-isoprenylcysteine O-methyltransferase Ste14